MKTKKEIEWALLKMCEKERRSGNSRLRTSNMAPRNYGKIHALRWMLDQVDFLDKKIELEILKTKTKK